jgi:2-C-methyl-D-erythritol 4-phosphate cytidylyltransferase
VRVAAVLLAGGSGTRFGGPVPKALVPLGGRSVLTHGLALLDGHPDVGDVVVVVREQDREAVAASADARHAVKVRAVVAGGPTRQASERAGVQAAAALDPPPDLVLVHDAARALCPPDLVTRLVDACRGPAVVAIPGLPVEDLLVDDAGRPVAADDLVAVQTPQAAPLDVLLGAHAAAAAAGVEGLDTAETVRAVADVEVRWVPGDPANRKLTHPEDLAALETVLARRRGDP